MAPTSCSKKPLRPKLACRARAPLSIQPVYNSPATPATSTLGSMEVHPLLGQLDSLLTEEKGAGHGSFGPGAPGSGISPGMRDGSAHVLRCLKVWYDLPSDVFHTAVNNIDTFLTKTKAKPKH